jgi:hypothetical protein
MLIGCNEGSCPQIRPIGRLTARPVVFKFNDYSEETKQLFQVERSCIVQYALKDGTSLYYRFFMVNLAQWREIEQGARGLVEGFRRVGAARRNPRVAGGISAPDARRP